MFGVGWYNASCLIFLNSKLINCFLMIWAVLRRTCKSAVVLKRVFYSSGSEKDRL